jgi:hypothetical protein
MSSGKSEPVDKVLYDKIVDEVNKSYKKSSAYRSMAYVKSYMKAYKEKHGNENAYVGKNTQSLKKWRKEKWVDVKSVLKDPENPVACGNAEIKKGEYPLCMKTADLENYSKKELEAFVERKNELGQKTLVKRSRGRPKLSEEQLALNKQATLQKRKIAREQMKEANALKRTEEKLNRNAEKEAAEQMVKENKSNRVMRYRENEAADSKHNLAYYLYKRKQIGIM